MAKAYFFSLQKKSFFCAINFVCQLFLLGSGFKGLLMLHEKHRPGCADQNLSPDKMSKINFKFVSDSLNKMGVGIQGRKSCREDWYVRTFMNVLE